MTTLSQPNLLNPYGYHFQFSLTKTQHSTLNYNMTVSYSPTLHLTRAHYTAIKRRDLYKQPKSPYDRNAHRHATCPVWDEAVRNGTQFSSLRTRHIQILGIQ
ncbi:unnamed protein product [Brugia pahangi]|uniref:Ovule protein n=1 Tax=Brugia pahangi TaxID=6280 RepID=A0A0N4TQG3_BRUPA|nr:unnamed protein product [Brugia pahangi]